MNLIIDIGNSRIKWARFDERQLIESGMVPHTGLKALSSIMNFHRNDGCCISSVVELTGSFKHFCKSINAMMIDHRTPVPITNRYSTPETLGIDRLCAAVGAQSLFPGAPVLSIDIGTCIKYEFVNRKGEYLGGNISPGLRMRFAALNRYTSRLPELEPSFIKGPLGTSTDEALQLGVQQGMLFEIRTMIRTMKALHPNMRTVGTGGDLPFFVNELKTHIFADLLLVLRGINEIYLYNS